MCPGPDSASKSEYQDIPGSKCGRCVRLTTDHLHVPIVKKSGGLNRLEPCGPVQTCNGTTLPLLGRYMALSSTQLLTEKSTRNIFWRPMRRADNLTNFVCRFSWNLGASPSWNHQGLFRPLQGLLYLLHRRNAFGVTTVSFLGKESVEFWVGVGGLVFNHQCSSLRVQYCSYV